MKHLGIRIMRSKRTGKRRAYLDIYDQHSRTGAVTSWSEDGRTVTAYFRRHQVEEHDLSDYRVAVFDSEAPVLSRPPVFDVGTPIPWYKLDVTPADPPEVKHAS